MNDIREVIRESRKTEVDDMLNEKIAELESEGYTIEFGKIGTHTTYALLVNTETSDEIVGYTFIKDMKYYKENVGKLKALQQALARKRVAEESK